MATGVVGIISSCESTVTSIYAFIALSAISATLGFYLLISATIPVDSLSRIQPALVKKQFCTFLLFLILFSFFFISLLIFIQTH